MRSIFKLVELGREGIDGRDWYDQAQDRIDDLCCRRGWNAELFTGILAVTSPRVAVVRNLRITLHYMATGDFLPNVMRAIRESVNHYLVTGGIRGPKTEPFYRALLGDRSAIVLDVWMAKALGIDQTQFSRKPIRAEANRRIEAAGRKLGLCPRDTQAAIWTGIVRRSGQTPGRFNPQREYANMMAWGGRFPDGPIKQLADEAGRIQPQLF